MSAIVGTERVRRAVRRAAWLRLTVDSCDHDLGEQDCAECGPVVACETCGFCLGAGEPLCEDCEQRGRHG